MFQTHSKNKHPFLIKFKEYLKFRKLRLYVKWKEEEQKNTSLQRTAYNP